MLRCGADGAADSSGAGAVIHPSFAILDARPINPSTLMCIIHDCKRLQSFPRLRIQRSPKSAQAQLKFRSENSPNRCRVLAESALQIPPNRFQSSPKLALSPLFIPWKCRAKMFRSRFDKLWSRRIPNEKFIVCAKTAPKEQKRSRKCIHISFGAVRQVYSYGNSCIVGRETKRTPKWR